MDEEIAICNYVAATYIDAGYYESDSKRLDRLSRILPKLPNELVEHILSFRCAKPVVITPSKFREYELIFFVGKKWRQMIVGKFNKYVMAPIPKKFFETPHMQLTRHVVSRTVESQAMLVSRFGIVRTGNLIH